MWLPNRSIRARRGQQSWAGGSSRWRTGLVAVAVAGLITPIAAAGPVGTSFVPTELPPADTSAYGATGQLTDLLMPGQEGEPGSPATADDPKAGGPGGAADAGRSPTGIPSGVLAGYRGAEQTLARTASGCRLPWSLVAGIGKVESEHARGGRIDGAGTTLAPILGPRLDGSGATAAIADTDGSLLDGDPTWDRAVGPTQFIPSTWATYGADGNDDGRADPNNVHDAALATGRYLCAGGLDLADPAEVRQAVFRYNHSHTYVNTVLRWATAYAGGVTAVPDNNSATPADTPADVRALATPSTAPTVTRDARLPAPVAARGLVGPPATFTPGPAPAVPVGTAAPRASRAPGGGITSTQPRPATPPAVSAAKPATPSTTPAPTGSEPVILPATVCGHAFAPAVVGAAFDRAPTGLAITSSGAGTTVRCTVAIRSGTTTMPSVLLSAVLTRYDSSSAARARAADFGPVGTVQTGSGESMLIGISGTVVAQLRAPASDVTAAQARSGLPALMRQVSLQVR